MKRNNLHVYLLVCLIIIISQSMVLVSCDDSGGADSDSDPEPLELFEEDSMDKEYSDYWISDDGEMGLILKDNTFMWVPNPEIDSSGRTAQSFEKRQLTPGTMGELSSTEIETSGTTTTGLIEMESTTFYLSEEVVTDIAQTSSLMAFLNEMGEGSSLYEDFDLSESHSDLELDQWITEEEFEDGYIEYQSYYYEEFFEYVEETYIEVAGQSVESLIPAWDSLKDSLLDGTIIDTTSLDDYFPTESWDFSITETETEKTMTYHSMEGTDYSFLQSSGCILYTP